MSKQKKDNPTIKETFSTVSSKKGSKSLAAAAIVLAVVIAANVLVSLLPEKYASFDLSRNDMFAVSDTSKNLVSALKDDVTIYTVCTSGSSDKRVSVLLESYADLSDHIKLKTVDPEKNPTFTSKYTDGEVDDNTLIIVSGDRSRVITYQDLYDLEVNYSTYQYEATGFCAENAVTNAIDYVTGAEITKIGFVTGHKEVELEETANEFLGSLQKANYEFDSVNLISKDGIADDIDCLAVISPSVDFSKADVDTLKAYLKKGGKMMFATDLVTKADFPNLYDFITSLGINLVDGIVFEADTTRVYQAYSNVLPSIGTHAITNGLDGMYVLVPGTQGFEIPETLPENLMVDSLLTTSDKAFSVTDYENKKVPAFEKDKGDIMSNGGFSLGAAITDTATDGDGTANIVYFSSSSFIDSQADQIVSGANSTLFVNSFNWLCEKENTVSIPSKSLAPETLLIPEATASVLKVAFIGIIPAAVLLAGIIIFITRRKR